MKLISWNVNGLRACVQKGFFESVSALDADVICLQETKMQEGQFDGELPGYQAFYNYAEKKGYSGTAVFTRVKPLGVSRGIGIEEHDREGRVITVEFDAFYLVCCYTPNAQRELARLDYRMKWEDDFLAYLKGLNEKKQVLFMRVFVVVFIVISAVIAIFQYKTTVNFIAQLMGISWGALAGAFLAPFLYGLYWKRTTKAACWVSFLFGSILMLMNMFVRTSFPVLLQSPINCGAFAMLAGLVIVPVVSLFTAKPDQKLVDDAFASYDVKVNVSQKRALTD